MKRKIVYIRKSLMYMFITIIACVSMIIDFDFKEHKQEISEEKTEENIEENKNIVIKEETEEEPVINYIDCDVPNNTMKSYMDYRTITSIESRQYKLQLVANTDDKGIRKVGDRYCIALGSYYTTTIGQYVDVELENGTIIQCILADCKSDIHTDSNNQAHIVDGSVVEFVVDTDYLVDIAAKMGNISYVDDTWNSKVINIRVYDKIEEF